MKTFSRSKMLIGSTLDLGPQTQSPVALDRNQAVVDRNQVEVDRNQVVVDHNRVVVGRNQAVVGRNQVVVDRNHTGLDTHSCQYSQYTLKMYTKVYTLIG